MISDFLPVIRYGDDVDALLGAVSMILRDVIPRIETKVEADYKVYFDERPDTAI